MVWRWSSGRTSAWLRTHRSVGQLIPVLSSYLKLTPHDSSTQRCALQHILHQGKPCGPHGRARRGEERGARHHRRVCWEVRLCKKKWQEVRAPGPGRAGRGCTTAQVCTASSPIFLPRDETVVHRPSLLVLCSASAFCQAGESASQIKVMLPRTGRNLYCKETGTGMCSWAVANGIELHCSSGGVREQKKPEVPS